MRCLSCGGYMFALDKLTGRWICVKCKTPRPEREMHQLHVF